MDLIEAHMGVPAVAAVCDRRIRSLESSGAHRDAATVLTPSF